MVPLNNLTNVIPAVMTRKTIARATAKPEVYFNESAGMKQNKKMIRLFTIILDLLNEVNHVTYLNSLYCKMYLSS